MAKVGRVFIDSDRLRRRVDELASEIAESGPEELVVVGKLTGAVIFLADLTRKLSPHLEVDFLGVTSYAGGDPPRGMARLVKDVDRPVAGRDVLVVEDVVDTGLSVQFLLRHLEDLAPASLRVCTLLEREDKLLADVPVAFRGFSLGDEYLVGYGLDFKGRYRNLPCLVVIDDLEALHADPLALVEQLRGWGVWR